MNAPLDIDVQIRGILRRLQRRRRLLSGGFALGLGAIFLAYMTSLTVARDRLAAPIGEGLYFSYALTLSFALNVLCLIVTAAYVAASQRWLQPLIEWLRRTRHGR